MVCAILLHLTLRRGAALDAVGKKATFVSGGRDECYESRVIYAGVCPAYDARLYGEFLNWIEEARPLTYEESLERKKP